MINTVCNTSRRMTTIANYHTCLLRTPPPRLFGRHHRHQCIGKRKRCSFHVSPYSTSLKDKDVACRFFSATKNSTTGSLPSTFDVKIVEVGPRDGLQNESQAISVQDKLQLIHRLQTAGLQNLEVGAFVSPKWVPQMADSDKIVQYLAQERQQQLDHNNNDNSNNNATSNYSVLVPNRKGLESALQYHEAIDEIAIFAAASETFSQRNINSTIQESMERFQTVMDGLKEFSYSLIGGTQQERPPIRVRGYVSTVIACPYQGNIAPTQVAKVVEQLLDLGCYEISLGDTIGVGTPGTVRNMLEEVTKVVDRPEQLALHFHDTYGQALANILAGMEQFGIYTIDSSVAGLGGCPYAKGASGNVATEDVVYMLEDMGLSTGVNLPALVDAGECICKVLNDRRNGSKVAQAFRGLSDCPS